MLLTGPLSEFPSEVSAATALGLTSAWPFRHSPDFEIRAFTVEGNGLGLKLFKANSSARTIV